MTRRTTDGTTERVTELYRDPVYDGATDPTVVIAPDGCRMFYTRRRRPTPIPGRGVSWVYGSRIGVARSADGVAWEYAGTLEPTKGAPDAAGLALEPVYRAPAGARRRSRLPDVERRPRNRRASDTPAGRRAWCRRPRASSRPSKRAPVDAVTGYTVTIS